MEGGGSGSHEIDRSQNPPTFVHSPVIALFEHVLALRVERPVISLALSSALSRDFDEALVERQVVTNRILPPFLVLLVKREFVDNELVDLR